MSDKNISILMPIYNGIEFLHLSLESIKHQSYKNYELIIGINGHPPNSEVYTKAIEEVNKYPDNNNIIIYDFYETKGKSNTLNKMINMCKYDWISLLDVDDAWHPQKLEIQTRYIGDYDVIGTYCKYFGDLNNSPSLPVGDLSGFNFLQYNPIINSSCIIRKTLAKWDPTVDGVEDYDLWLKLKKQNKKFYNVNEVLTFHRIHLNSAFNSKGNNLLVDKIKKRYINIY